MAQEHHLTVQRTARYYTLGQLTDQTKNIWFCLHGFGQLAQYFSRKFTNVANEQTLIVVPEGLSRLYLNGEYQRVGASWTTREDREYEISDYVGYLNRLYTHILSGRSPEQFSVTLLGFSQGAATACRWLNSQSASSSPMPVSRLILWAGYFPNGLSDMIDPAKLTGVECHYVYGREDEYIKLMPDAAAYTNRLKTEVPTLTITAFDGGHHVEPEVLKQLFFGEKKLL